ncbi:linear amide C-N hydrolase, partial [Bifidobacterium longum]|nr:linear amide C-N hydrolase [Bifidobacterium longum]
NVSPFEFVSCILGQCATLAEAKVLLDKINLVKIDFSEQLPLSPLHWLMAETASEKTLTIECDRDGLHVYDNPVGVLTNNPQ